MSKAGTTTGLLTDDDLSESPERAVSSGVFGGYAYLNLSVTRVAALRFPGAKIEDIDVSVFGSAPGPPHIAQKGDKNFLAGLRGLRYLWRTLKITSLPHLDDDKARVRRMRETAPNLTTASDEELYTFMLDVRPIFEELFTTHLIVSGQAGLATTVLTKLCENRLKDAKLAYPLLAGIGDVESAAPSASLFALGRLVRESEPLTRVFDDGLDGLEGRLEKSHGLDASAFRQAFADFLAEFGSRGPNEWDIGAETWGVNHRLPLALIDRMRGADADHDPELQHARLSEERDAAMTLAVPRLRGLNRRIFKRAFAASALLSQGRERAKTTIVAAIHEWRLVIRELDRRTTERSGGQERDIFLVTADELESYLADPTTFADQIATRRAMYAELERREPPFFFVGTQPPIDTWKLRGEAVEPFLAGTVLKGLPGCPGVARGRARVVTDPSEPGALGPGDVLVAPFTDPAWTPLFVPAEAVVVDVGAVMSHAAIVSRELGIPCVVSVTGASSRIPDGAMLEVDGTAGTVTVLDTGS